MTKKILKNTSESLPTWDLQDFYKSINDPKISQDLKKSSQNCDLFVKKCYNCYRTQIIRMVMIFYDNISANLNYHKKSAFHYVCSKKC